MYVSETTNMVSQVHRSAETVTTVKMLSSCTTTSECVNSENPFGFHLSDGVVYTYSTGAEYEDMFAGMDCNIPPGITTDYSATKLKCKTAMKPGVDSYADGVQANNTGMAAMQYINPLSKTFGFNKAGFSSRITSSMCFGSDSRWRNMALTVKRVGGIKVIVRT